MIDAYEKNNLVLISPTATLGSLSDLSFSDRFMRTAPSDISLTQELVKAIPPRAKILVVYDSQSPYSRQLKDQLHNQYITINGIINELDLSKDNLKFNQYGDTFAKMVNEKNITAIVLFPDKDTPPQAIDLAIANERQLGTKKLPLFGNTVLYENIHLIRGGSALEGMILSVPGSDSSCYISQAKKDWGGGISWRTQTSFDAAKTLIGLLKRVIDSNQEVTHKSLWDEAAKGITISGNENSCQTLGQTIRFLSNGDFAGEPRLVQVKGARFVPYLPK
jgi:ABC-type branched-subunit amino acid transport system substrate-binding protein